MSPEIVPLRVEHFEGLRAALDTVAREKRFLAFQAAPSQVEAFAFCRNIIEQGQPHFVAIVDGSAAGWCDVLPTHGESRAHVGVLGIALIPAARHRGFGAALIRATISVAWQKGLTRIELTVRLDNANAKALYERMGFSVEGVNRQAFRVDDAYRDSYSMGPLRQ